jgi:pyruvate,water dikinase
MNFIKFFKDISVNDLNLVGGKGLSLGRMINEGIPVPPGFVITTGLHKDFMNSNILSEQTKNDLYTAFDTLGASRVAVRSSAISEDSETASWAGQFESYLNVGRDELIKRVQDCWGSVTGAGAYAKTQGMKEEELALGVVVQKMVDSEVSGVAFSVNPLNHDSDEIMIEATYGLGELLVQGMVTPDNYVVSKQNKNLVSSRIVIKTTMLIYKDGESKEIPVSSDMQEKSCLTDEQLRDLCSLVCQIEDYYESPQDIEWALHDNRFYIVQSRPITV